MWGQLLTRKVSKAIFNSSITNSDSYWGVSGCKPLGTKEQRVRKDISYLLLLFGKLLFGGMMPVCDALWIILWERTNSLCRGTNTGGRTEKYAFFKISLQKQKPNFQSKISWSVGKVSISIRKRLFHRKFLSTFSLILTKSNPNSRPYWKTNSRFLLKNAPINIR